MPKEYEIANAPQTVKEQRVVTLCIKYAVANYGQLLETFTVYAIIFASAFYEC